MSGCHPTEIKCKCDCCECREEDASLMVKKIQELEECVQHNHDHCIHNSDALFRDMYTFERQIESLTKDYVHLSRFGTPVVVESLKVLEERIKELDSRLESQIEQFHDNNKVLFHDIKHLDECFRDYQEDNGSCKLGVKGDIVSLNQCYLELEERLKEVSDWMLDKQELFKYFDERIINIDRTVMDIVDNVTGLANHCYKEKKTPHKCPVCDGEGYNKPEIRATMQSMSVDGVQCKAGESVLFKATCRSCKGKGVLWG